MAIYLYGSSVTTSNTDASGGRRLAYDIDGSAVVDSTGTSLGSINITSLNDEDQTTLYLFTPGSGIYFYFPNPITFQGFCLLCDEPNTTNIAISYSLNSTNPLNGNWNPLSVGFQGFNPAADAYRGHTIGNNAMVNSGPIEHVVAVRMINQAVYNIDIWHFSIIGYYASLSGNYVDFCNTSYSIPISGVLAAKSPAAWDLDFQDQMRGTAATASTYFLKNFSGSGTANNIVITTNDCGISTLGAQAIMISLDGINFAASRTISSLAPGATQTIWVQCALPGSFPLTVAATRLTATVGNWT